MKTRIQRATTLHSQFGMSMNAALAVARAEHYNATGSAFAHNDGTHEIKIYTTIGDDWFGFTPTDLAGELDRCDGGDVTLRINSPGGNVWDAVTCYNLIQDYPGSVTAIIDGEASSAASFLPMAADRVEMSAAGLMMIHNAWVLAVGNAGELREVAETLDKVDGIIADIYAVRSGGDASDFAGLMEEETFLTAEEAAGLGLVDHVRPLASKPDTEYVDMAAAAGKRTAHARSEIAKMAVASIGVDR